jgi:hypothetical protein
LEEASVAIQNLDQNKTTPSALEKRNNASARRNAAGFSGQSLENRTKKPNRIDAVFKLPAQEEFEPNNVRFLAPRAKRGQSVRDVAPKGRANPAHKPLAGRCAGVANPRTQTVTHTVRRQSGGDR